ncbi:MAG: hypothetical protein CML20_00320 [Rheinheimera sp.]|uniref:hypothetical protein n=1 Tax=Arsukibacterium sp. UBA3155 TaxID=1946058 RepID=UPI000C92EC6A|nr:hypothetical protein [Arsukibacterium sp. UBA3155]MAD73249.1 hypothetical protein [Rheinheimera sp.]|tara:strand:- start:80994 stop:81599 length:606 start_codon:yes stop_codon:yes gene_type:complete
MKHQNQKVKLAVTSLLAFLLMLTLSVSAVVMLTAELRHHANAIASGSPLIIISSMHTYGPGIIVGAFSGALLFLLYFMYRCVFQTETLFFKRSEKILASLASIGLVVIFVGSHLITSHWQSKADTAGFVPCPAMTLLSNRVTMEVWVRDEALCYDGDVRRILRRGTKDETTQVAQYLSVKEKQQQARQKFLKQETPSKNRG